MNQKFVDMLYSGGRLFYNKDTVWHELLGISKGMSRTWPGHTHAKHENIEDLQNFLGVLIL